VRAGLGIIISSKCGESMKEEKLILVITEGNIAESDDDLTLQGSCVRYAWHLDCRNGAEENGGQDAR